MSFHVHAPQKMQSVQLVVLTGKMGISWVAESPVSLSSGGPSPGITLHQVLDELHDFQGALLVGGCSHLPSDGHQASRNLPTRHCSEGSKF